MRFHLIKIALLTVCATLTACSQNNNTSPSQSSINSQAVINYEDILKQVQQVTPEQMKGVTINVIDGLFGSLQLKPAGLDNTPYKINFIQAMNASDQMALLLSGRADLNVYGDISFAGIVAADVPLTIVHGMQRPAKPCGIAVRKDSPITSITELKGKNIANTTGFSSEIVAVRAFKEHGLNFFKDANVIEMKTLADARLAFLNERVDAWVGCHEAYNGTILDGYARSLVNGENGRWVGQTYWGVHHNAFKDIVRLAAVLDYIKRVDQSFDWANANPEQLGEIMAKVFKTDAAPLQRYMKWSGPSYGIAVDSVMINGLQATYDLEAEIGRLPNGKSVRPYFTEAFNPYFKLY